MKLFTVPAFDPNMTFLLDEILPFIKTAPSTVSVFGIDSCSYLLKITSPLLMFPIVELFVSIFKSFCPRVTIP